MSIAASLWKECPCCHEQPGFPHCLTIANHISELLLELRYHLSSNDSMHTRVLSCQRDSLAPLSSSCIAAPTTAAALHQAGVWREPCGHIATALHKLPHSVLFLLNWPCRQHQNEANGMHVHAHLVCVGMHASKCQLRIMAINGTTHLLSTLDAQTKVPVGVTNNHEGLRYACNTTNSMKYDNTSRHAS